MVENDEYDCGICTKTRFTPGVGVHGLANLSGYRPCKDCILPRLLQSIDNLQK